MLMDRPKKVPYKTGEIPDIGDLVWRWRSKEEKLNAYKQYGTVIGHWVSSSNSIQLPIICWINNPGLPRNTLAGVVRLVTRGKQDA